MSTLGSVWKVLKSHKMYFKKIIFNIVSGWRNGNTLQMLTVCPCPIPVLFSPIQFSSRFLRPNLRACTRLNFSPESNFHALLNPWLWADSLSGFSNFPNKQDRNGPTFNKNLLTPPCGKTDCPTPQNGSLTLPRPMEIDKPRKAKRVKADYIFHWYPLKFEVLKLSTFFKSWKYISSLMFYATKEQKCTKQFYSICSVCFLYSFRLFLLPNLSPHIAHGNFFNRWWMMSMWWSRFLLSPYAFPHSSQL